MKTIKWFLFLSFLVLWQPLSAQKKVKLAFKQYEKGNIESALNLLDVIDPNERETEYYFVRVLCTLENTELDAFPELVKALNQSNPTYIVDPKLKKKLNNIYALNSDTYTELKYRVYLHIFQHYLTQSSYTLWNKHLALFPESVFRDSAFYLSASTGLQEALNDGGNPKLLEEVYKKYNSTVSTQHIAKEAYQSWATIEFTEAENINSSIAYKAFAQKFPDVDLAKSARLKAQNIDKIQALNSRDTTLLQSYISTYGTSAESKEALSLLDSLHFQYVLEDFSLQKYARYVRNFPSTPLRHILDSIFDMHLLEAIDHAEFEYVRVWHNIQNRLRTTTEAKIIQRRLENTGTTYYPFCNGFENYTIGLHNPASNQNILPFEADYILRDGNSLFRFQKDGKWGVLYVSQTGNIQQVGSPSLFDNVSPLKGNYYQVSLGDRTGVMDLLGNILLPLKNQKVEILSNGNMVIERDSKNVLFLTLQRDSIQFSNPIQIWQEFGILEFKDVKNISTTGVSLFDFNGEILLSGKKITIIDAPGRVQNLKVDGKAFLYSAEDHTWLPSPKNEAIVYYKDDRNYISYTNNTYSFTVNGGQRDVLKTTYANLYNDSFFTFRLTDGSTKIMAAQNFGQLLTIDSRSDFEIQEFGVVVKNPFNTIQIYKPNGPVWGAAISVPNANGFYVEYYGYDEGEGGYYEEGDGTCWYLGGIQTCFTEFNDGMYYFPTTEVSYTSSKPKIPQELFIVAEDDQVGAVNSDGTFVIPANYSSLTFSDYLFHGIDSDGEIEILNANGSYLTRGSFLRWINSTTFLYFRYGSGVTQMHQYSTDTKQSTLVCTSCFVRNVFDSETIEVESYGHPAIIKLGRTTQWLGNFTKSPYYTFRTNFESIQNEYYADEYRSYSEYTSKFESLRDESNVVFNGKENYNFAKLRLGLAIEHSGSDIASLLSNIQSFPQFVDEEMVQVYSGVAHHYESESDYQTALRYYGILYSILPEDEFIRNYGYSIANCYYQNRDFGNAINYYTRYANSCSSCGYSGYFRAGLANFENGNYQAAIASWNKAISSAIQQKNQYVLNDGVVYLNIGAAYANLNNDVMKCKYYNIAKGKGNSDAANRFNWQCD